MLVPAVPRSIIERGRRSAPAERPVVADVGPDAARDRLALGQDRHRGVIAVQPLGGQHMALDQRMKRLQRRRAGADLVGQRRQAQIDALAPVALALAVQRLMLAELLEQDHGQQVGAGEAARRHMEGCRRLRDRLAFPARELLAHRLDHLPLARNHLQRLGDVLAQLRQLARAAARTALGRGDHDALARQMIGERLARRPLALERLDGLRPRRRLLGRQLILRRRRLQLLELKLHLLQQPRLVLRARAVELAAQLLDLELEMAISASVLERSACAFAASALALAASLALAAALARSPLPSRLPGARRVRQGSSHARQRDRRAAIQTTRSCAERITSVRDCKSNRHPTDVGRHVSCGLRQSMPDNR